ncbi:hypothetical protein LIER_33539 [Lithospermum erythrorhizon]|uniref:DUF3475 domain-containing protein n=1 Tax=Lithospermum erythrorhizon TaxID=34254 RepID=A0AAV3S2N9_LITER
MGGLCSRRCTADSTIGRGLPQVNGHYSAGMTFPAHSSSVQPDSNLVRTSRGEDVNKQPRDIFSFPEVNVDSHGTNMDNVYDGIPRLPRASSNKYGSTRSKVAEMSSLLGKAGTAGIGKAVDVLDTLGSSMTNLSHNSGFASGMTTKGIKISILAFEVANTVVKGANLMHSLDEDNVKHLKEVVLPSEGVQKLISKDRDELLKIAAADKREELKIFSGEIVRFGNRCKDPQWHNLDRYFEKLESELSPHRQLKEEALTVMNQLMNLVQYTAELYHEMHALDRFQQDYNRKLQEEDNSSATPRGDTLAILRAELKSQKKHVNGLKKKSLWSKVLEEVMEKLVDFVHYLHLEIHATFGSADGNKSTKNSRQKLGSCGLALHYANVITQIDTLVTRSSSVPPNTRDSLYQGLPPNVKASLCSKLQSFHGKEEVFIFQSYHHIEYFYPRC